MDEQYKTWLDDRTTWLLQTSHGRREAQRFLQALASENAVGDTRIIMARLGEIVRQLLPTEPKERN